MINAEVKRLSDLGDYELSCSNFENAYAYFKSAIEIDPRSAYAFYKRSFAAGKLKRMDEFATGFNKAIELCDNDPDLLSEIKCTYYMELANGCYEGAHNSYVIAHKLSGRLDREVLENEYCKSCEEFTRTIINIRNRIKLDNLLSDINDKDAISAMVKLHDALVKIAAFKGSFGSFDKFWRAKVGREVIPTIDNSAAWLNYKLGEKKYPSVASVFF